MGGAQASEHARRRQRKLVKPNTCGVMQSSNYRRGIGDEWHLGHATGAERSNRIGQFQDIGVHLGRHLANARNEIGRETRVLDDAVDDLQVLAEGIPVGLYNPAFDLATEQLGADRSANVVGRRHLVNTDMTRLDINSELDGLGHVPIAKVRLTLAGFFVELLGLWRYITSKPDRRPFTFSPSLGSDLGGGHD